MPNELDKRALGHVLQGLGRLLAEPDRLTEFLERAKTIARNGGKAQALRALELAGLDDASKERIRAELERLFPTDPK